MSDKHFDVVRGRDGEPCTDLCALPPEETVLIEKGATVYLPGPLTCFWCNVSAGEAELLVFPAVPNGEAFSWTLLGGINAGVTPDSARLYHGATWSRAGVGCR